MKKALLIFSWALYDLANQFFLLNIVSLYFVRWLTLEKKTPEIFYSLAFGASTLLIALASPVLGGISDATQKRRAFLTWLTLISVVFTMLLGKSSSIFINLLFFALANFGCSTAVVFYNAQLADLAGKERIGFVSGLGRVFAYSGAFLALFLVKPQVVKYGPQAAFFPSGVYFLILALPCLLFIKDKKLEANTSIISFFKKDKIGRIFSDLKQTVFSAYTSSHLSDFLKSVFFGLCAVNAVTLFMSVYATKVFGLNQAQVINLIAFSTLFAIIGSIVSGVICDYIGTKRSMLAVFSLWTASFVIAAFAKNITAYWLIGAIVGFALGSTWVVLRVMAIRLVPHEKIGEIFGLFNLAGYLSGIIGAIFWGAVLYFLKPLEDYSYRIALLCLVPFMALGMIFLLRLPANQNDKK